MSPTVEAFLVIPAAPHSTFNRAIMLGNGEHLELRVLGASGELAVEVDGIVSGHVKGGDVFVVPGRPGGRAADPARPDDVLRAGPTQASGLGQRGDLLGLRAWPAGRRC